MRFAPVVGALQAMRGIQFVHAVTLLAELGDLTRFGSARALMGYLGLVPREDSSCAICTQCRARPPTSGSIAICGKDPRGSRNVREGRCIGEYVGLEEIDNGIWNVYFGPLKLGRLIERHMKIEDAFGRLARHHA